MELRHFRYFESISELLSFSKAAQVLRVAQPALSKQIKDFENELGFLVFERVNRSIKLTPAGHELLNSWKKINGNLESAIQACRKIAVENEKSISIGFLGTPCFFFLPKIIKSFHRNHSDTRLKLIEGNQPGISNLMQKGSLDIILNRPSDFEKGIVQRTLYKDCLYFVSEYKDNNLNPEEILILSEKADPHIHKVSLRLLSASKKNYKFSLIDSVQVAISLVKAGIGHAILPGSVALSDDFSLNWTPIQGSNIFLCYQYAKHNEKKLVHLIKLLSEESSSLTKRLEKSWQEKSKQSQGSIGRLKF